MNSQEQQDRRQEVIRSEAPANREAHRRARMDRVTEYEAGALAEDDSLSANLACMNGSLMRTSMWLDEMITESMASAPPTVDRLQKILPAIDTQLKVTRQVDRFMQIAVRIAESGNGSGSRKRPDSTASHGESQSEESPM